LAPLAADNDEILWLPKGRSINSETPFAATTSTVDANHQPVQSSSTQAALEASPRKAVWLVSGLAALVVAGAAFKLISNPSVGPHTLASIASASSAAPRPSASAPDVCGRQG